MRCRGGIGLMIVLGLACVPGVWAEEEHSAQQTFDQVVAAADGEALARMLIERKARRAALGANGADPRLGELDGQIAAIHERLAGVLQGREAAAPRVEESPPPVLVFPRIVPALPMAPTGSMAAASGFAPAMAAPQGPAAATPLEGPEDAAAFKRLESPATLAARDVPLQDALSQVETQCRVPIRVNWRALAGAGIEPQTKVTYQARELAAGRILAGMLAEAGGGTANLGYTVQDGGAVVSTRDDLNSARFHVVRVYDVQDLLTPAGLPYAHLPAGALYELRIHQITNLSDTIKAVIAPDTWRDNGGTIGSMREINGLLVVTQTRDNHREVEQLLAMLRRRQ